jgi:DNA-binding phage protein
MTEPVYDYDPATALDSPEAIALFIADAFETGDAMRTLQRHLRWLHVLKA